MFIVIGLGNPGKKYAKTRHNVGFMVADALKLRIKNAKLRIIKPDTFMNRSGEAVKGKKAEDLVVIHDDIDLALGTIRVRRGGSSAGHKGVASIIEALGSDDFVRVKIGVSRPPKGVEAERYVLQPFEAGESKVLKKTIDAAVKLVLESLESGKFEEITVTC